MTSIEPEYEQYRLWSSTSGKNMGCLRDVINQRALAAKKLLEMPMPEEKKLLLDMIKHCNIDINKVVGLIF